MKRISLLLAVLMFSIVSAPALAQEPTETPTPTPTATFTLTPTSTPDLMVLATLPSGQVGGLEYRVTAGDLMLLQAVQIQIGVQIFIAFFVLGIFAFALFVGLRRGNE